jgi:hypothetical protein
MKAEERKRLERNELAARLSEYWSGKHAASPRVNRVWTVILIVLVVILGWVVYGRWASGRAAARWTDLAFAFNNEKLNEVIKDAPGSTPAMIAKMQLARVNFSEAMAKLASPTAEDRTAAAEKLEQARRLYGEVAGVSDMPPVLHQEALLQQARAEETLAAVPKPDGTGMRGSLEAALKHYDDLKGRFGTSPAGEQAAKRAADLRAHKAEVESLYSELAHDHGKAAAPSAPLGTTPAPPANPAPPQPK